MAKPLNVEERKQEIARRAFDVLAKDGPAGLTIQAVADEMGGSITLVTHVFPTRAELTRGTVDYFISSLLKHEEIEKSADPLEVLKTELVRMAPLDDTSRQQERGRVLMIGERDQESAKIFADAMENHNRQRLRSCLSGIVPEDHLEQAVDFIRSFVNGLVLSAVEHPKHWTSERQNGIIDLLLTNLTTLFGYEESPPSGANQSTEGLVVKQ